jgi:hypothetical protein
MGELMEITTTQFRKSVTGWLTEEEATVDQALELQSAIEAGAIEGTAYEGHRPYPNGPIREVVAHRKAHGLKTPFLAEMGVDRSCGCLVDTLERIRGGRPSVPMPAGPVAETFALALNIHLGDTPKNSKWARAVVKGIENYLVAVEA